MLIYSVASYHSGFLNGWHFDKIVRYVFVTKTDFLPILTSVKLCLTNTVGDAYDECVNQFVAVETEGGPSQSPHCCSCAWTSQTNKTLFNGKESDDFFIYFRLLRFRILDNVCMWYVFCNQCLWVWLGQTLKRWMWRPHGSSDWSLCGSSASLKLNATAYKNWRYTRGTHG